MKVCESVARGLTYRYELMKLTSHNFEVSSHKVFTLFVG